MAFIRARGRAIIPTTARTCIVRVCDVTIHRAHVACPHHWWMLPAELRNAIQTAKRGSGEGLRAVSMASVWYRANVTSAPDPS